MIAPPFTFLLYLNLYFLFFKLKLAIKTALIERLGKMRYEDLIFKIPQESATYREDSAFIIKQIMSILDKRKEAGDNKIIVNTNLKKGLPLENINKIAGPMVEAWAVEVFTGVCDNLENEYHLINVEAQERLGMSDIILQFRKNDNILTGNIGVKTTANDIQSSGKGPNITSFSRIRTTWQMCQLLDQKYLQSSRRTIDDFYREAIKNKWVKE